MALPTVQEVKDYLRIEENVENTLLAALLAEAEGTIEKACGKSLTTEEATWYDDAATLRIGEGVTNLFLQYVPIDPDSVVVLDANGVTVDPSNYTVRPDRGLIVGNGSPFNGNRNLYAFTNGPYTIQCTAGFGTSPTYATRELPMIKMLVIDFTAMLYQQRTPGARTERSAGSTVDYEIDPVTGLPNRIARGVRKLRGPVFAR